MPNEMSALECAKRLEVHNYIHYAKEGKRAHFITQALEKAISDERKLAAGELIECPVTCGECEYWRNGGCMFHTQPILTDKDYYCRDGERKEQK